MSENVGKMSKKCGKNVGKCQNMSGKVGKLLLFSDNFPFSTPRMEDYHTGNEYLFPISLMYCSINENGNSLKI